MDKSDLILKEIQSLNNKFDEKFGQVDKKFGQIDEKFEQIDRRFEQIDRRFESLESKIEKMDVENKEEHAKIFENLDRIDRRITRVDMDNRQEHIKICNLLDSINSAFIRYETEGLDKIKILFDADIDHKNHQDIYGHEFYRLNELVAKNSFRISNLEQYQ